MKRYLITPLLFLCFSALFASTPSDTFRLANEAIRNGQVNDAIQLYRAIADNGYESVALYHNLGTAYAKKEDWIEARYFLEKARMINPKEAAVLQNLGYVKEHVDDPYQFPLYPLFPAIEWIHAYLGGNFIAVCFLFFTTILLASIYMFVVSSRLLWQVLIWITALLFLVAGVFLFFDKTYYAFHDRMLILSEAKTAIYAKPDEFSEVVADLLGGHKLRRMETVGPWYRIDLADGTEGWILADKVRPLNPGS